MSLDVAEIFHSIQGESSHSGWPCVFVRLAGCNLRCTWCDTQYAYAGGKIMSVAEAVERVRAFGCARVEVTGGEPLLQEQTPELVARLLHKGHLVLIETNGSQNISLVPPGAVIIMDVKPPSSGESGAMDRDNFNRLRPGDELKFVIAGFEDYKWAAALIREAGPFQCVVHFAPVFGVLDPSVLVGWILKDRLNVRLNLQLHKYIWPPETRGV